ncbi:MAG TPA: SPOR domain-containing protein, partial [Acetobacteraceae bacterium]
MSDDISIPRPTYRVPRRSGGMDPATLRLALIAAGIGGTLLVAIAGWTMLSHRGHGVPVVQADSSPLRVKPVNPGGLQVAGAGNEIFSGGSDTDVEKLAPPPETPDP